ncbi:MAG: hypothetical protein WDN47_03860 [Candidatus Doudnabacteria bacterium]
MGENKEAQQPPRDITQEYLNSSPEEFKVFLNSLKDQPATIEITPSEVTPDIVNFLIDPKHKLKLKGTPEELEQFKQDFPGLARLMEF